MEPQTVSRGDHLLRRNGVYYYRRRVPRHAVATVGHKEISHGLGTSNLTEAKRFRNELDVRYDRIFADASRLALTPQAEPQANPVTPDVLASVDKYIAKLRARARQDYFANPPFNNDERFDMRVSVGTRIGILEDLDDPGAEDYVGSVLRKVVPDNRPDLLANVSLGEIVRRGLLTVEREALARIEDKGDLGGIVALATPVTPPIGAGPDLATAVGDYLGAVQASASANKKSQKWVDKQRAHCEVLQEIIGAATPIANIDFDTCERVQTALARVPAHRTKRYPSVPLDEAIRLAERDGADGLSSTTQDGYLRTLDGILDRAARKRLIGNNPAKGMKPLKKEVLAPHERRLPFTALQLQRFFHGKYYMNCALQAVPWKADSKGWRFWLPILCCYMGLRPNEACQLETSDLKTTHQGTAYLDFTASSDEGVSAKILKTQSSRRKVPIHPEVLALGFAQFVELRKKQGEKRLFPSLKPDQYGNVAKYALKRFREDFLPAEIDVLERQSFYSFRHNARDALRVVNAPGEVLEGVAGWKHPGNVSDRYGDKTDPDHTVRWVHQISFPGVDLSYLRPK
jgi:integrase